MSLFRSMVLSTIVSVGIGATSILAPLTAHAASPLHTTPHIINIVNDETNVAAAGNNALFVYEISIQCLEHAGEPALQGVCVDIMQRALTDAHNAQTTYFQLTGMPLRLSLTLYEARVINGFARKQYGPNGMAMLVQDLEDALLTGGYLSYPWSTLAMPMGAVTEGEHLTGYCSVSAFTTLVRTYCTGVATDDVASDNAFEHYYATFISTLPVMARHH